MKSSPRTNWSQRCLLVWANCRLPCSQREELLLGAKRAVEVARRKAVDEANRARYLDQLEKREEATWNQIAAHIQKRQPNEYDKAVTLLTDLHDLSERRGQAAAFQTAVAKLRRTLRAIKKSADDDRRAGRFLLTGSANILTLPQVSESLAGRMEIVSLLPLSRAEIRGKKPGFLKAAFDSKLGKPAEPMIGDDLIRAVLIGGYPEMLRRGDPKRRQTWAREYDWGHRAAGCTRSCRRGKA
jgi:predicted AAA+ superfamily ATPase